MTSEDFDTINQQGARITALMRQIERLEKELDAERTRAGNTIHNLQQYCDAYFEMAELALAAERVTQLPGIAALIAAARKSEEEY